MKQFLLLRLFSVTQLSTNKQEVSKTSQGHTAFTLAEVLITLGIIGVVAAMTIPTLIRNQKEGQFVSGVKKYYSILSEAIMQWENEEGCAGNIGNCISQYDNRDCKNAFASVEKKLHVVDRRYYDESVADIDWLPKEATNFNGTKPAYNSLSVSKEQSNSTFSCNYLLSDGTTLMVRLPAGDYTSPTYAGWIFFDLNGAKPPNRVGVDQFPIGLGSVGNKYLDVHPYFNLAQGNYNYGLCNVSQVTTCNPDDGYSPTAYVLLHNKLPDLKRMFGK